MPGLTYIPIQGDLVWLDFNPQAGHEQRGRRPALVVSPTEYNKRIGLALVCPITSQVKNYPFEVPLPKDLPISGVVLSDHLKSQDWRVRQAQFIAKAGEATLLSVLQRVRVLLTYENAP